MVEVLRRARGHYKEAVRDRSALPAPAVRKLRVLLPLAEPRNFVNCPSYHALLLDPFAVSSYTMIKTLLSKRR